MSGPRYKPRRYIACGRKNYVFNCGMHDFFEVLDYDGGLYSERHLRERLTHNATPWHLKQQRNAAKQRARGGSRTECANVDRELARLVLSEEPRR